MKRDRHLRHMRPVCRDGTCITDGGAYLEVENLSVRYGNQIAFEGVSADFKACQITALIGPSGCGKTSFLSCINRLTDLFPSCKVSGSIRLGGEDILAPHIDVQALRSRVGMVFQKPNPFPLSIWRNLALPLKEHGMRAKADLEQAIQTALEDVGLWPEVKDRLHASAFSLSGGQQQRLCIARTLALKPEVVLFDEPCSALDPLASRVVEELIYSLRSRFSVMIVTHNLGQARRIADDVAVFWHCEGRGRLIEFGTAQQVFEAPVHAQTLAYLNGTIG